MSHSPIAYSLPSHRRNCNAFYPPRLPRSMTSDGSFSMRMNGVNHPKTLQPWRILGICPTVSASSPVSTAICDQVI